MSGYTLQTSGDESWTGKVWHPLSTAVPNAANGLVPETFLTRRNKTWVPFPSLWANLFDTHPHGQDGAEDEGISRWLVPDEKVP